MFHGTQAEQKDMNGTEIQRDELGRVVGDDGYPIGGMATINEAVAVSGLSRSKIYDMITREQLEAKRFGKSRRITWQSLRGAFLTSEVGS